jgi:hypothetical protein
MKFVGNGARALRIFIFGWGFYDGEEAPARIRKIAAANGTTGWPDDGRERILWAGGGECELPPATAFL